MGWPRFVPPASEVQTAIFWARWSQGMQHGRSFGPGGRTVHCEPIRVTSDPWRSYYHQGTPHNQSAQSHHVTMAWQLLFGTHARYRKRLRNAPQAHQMLYGTTPPKNGNTHQTTVVRRVFHGPHQNGTFWVSENLPDFTQGFVLQKGNARVFCNVNKEDDDHHSQGGSVFRQTHIHSCIVLLADCGPFTWHGMLKGISSYSCKML